MAKQPRRPPSRSSKTSAEPSVARASRPGTSANGRSLYMLAVPHAQRGEHAEAVAHLERAIALNPENRALARNDPDLEPLREDDAFRAALEAPSIARADRRRPLKTRPAR